MLKKRIFLSESGFLGGKVGKSVVTKNTVIGDC